MIGIDLLLPAPPSNVTCKSKQASTHYSNHNCAPHASVKMPSYSIYPESLMAPNQFSPYLSVSFRRGVESRDPIVSPHRIYFANRPGHVVRPNL